MKQATLRDVSEKAGVSIATASKVVNGIRKGVSEQTLHRVQQVIKDLNYRPQRTGRELRTRRNYIVGMAIVYDSPTFLADPYVTHLVAGLSNYLGTHDYGLLLHGIQPDRFDESFLVRESIAVALAVMLSGPPDSREHHLRRLAATGLPLVVFQEHPLRDLPDSCFINQEDEHGARQLAEKIAARGGRNLFILTPDIDWYPVAARLQGFRQVFDRHGLPYHIVACNENSLPSINAALEDAIRTLGTPDLVVGTNDRLAHAAYQFLSARGAHIPQDIGMTGFNALGLLSLAHPRLESVQSPAYELGELGGQTLLARIQDGRFENRILTLPVQPAPGQTL